MSSIFIDVIRTDASRVDAQLLLGLRGESAYSYAVSQGYSGTEVEFAQLMASYAEVAERAAASASASSQSATEAAQSSSASVRSANEARQMARDALTYAQNASTSEQNASASASAAAQSESSASASASAAATSAESASDASESASQSAEQASASAQTASSAATRAEDARDVILAKTLVEDVTIDGTSIVDANNVADIPIMEKVTTYGSRAGLVPAFEGSSTKSPSRHYLNAAGVWRALKIEVFRQPSNVQLQFDGLSSILNAASSTNAGVMTAANRVKLDSIAEGAEVNVQSDWDQTDDTADDFIKNKPSVPTKVSDLENDVPYSTLEQMVSLLPTDTASGSIVTIPDGQSIVPAKSLKVALEPIQEGSGTPSPDNVRPISGRTEVVTQRTGKNLFSDVFADYTRPVDYRICPIKLKAGATYSYSFNLVGTQQSNFTVGIAKKGDRYTEFGAFVTVGNASTTTESGTFTVGSDYTDPKLIVFASNEATFNAIFENYEIQLELGSTATDYEPYQGTTYTTDLGQTVYGGVLDVVSGELVVDRAMVDLGTLNWVYQSYVPRFYADQLSEIINTPSRNDVPANIICSIYKTGIVPTANTPDGEISVASSGNLFIKDTRYTSASDFKTAMNGVQLVYELANPQTIQLTPQEVQLLLGTNNVWSDGDVTLVYNADIQRWVEKKLGA